MVKKLIEMAGKKEEKIIKSLKRNNYCSKCGEPLYLDNIVILTEQATFKEWIGCKNCNSKIEKITDGLVFRQR